MNLESSDENQVITCIDCNKPFVFTTGEQEFYLLHKLAEPKRCAKCRKAKREALQGNKGGSF